MLSYVHEVIVNVQASPHLHIFEVNMPVLLAYFIRFGCESQMLAISVHELQTMCLLALVS